MPNDARQLSFSVIIGNKLEYILKNVESCIYHVVLDIFTLMYWNTEEEGF